MAGVAQEATDDKPFEAEALGVSFDRIKYKLDRLPQRDELSSLLRLDFYVEVYARAPQIDYFQGFDLQHSPIAGGVPMNGEMLEVMRSGEPPLVPAAINLNNVLDWFRKLSR